MKTMQKYLIDETASVRDALVRLNALSSDVLTLFVMRGNQVIASLTDGDVRRMLIQGVSLSDPVMHVANHHFSSLMIGERNPLKMREIRGKGIRLLPCLDSEGQLVDIYDLKEQKTFLPINAVLMAGGKGERLRPLTQSKPKPLLPLGSKAIIDYNIDALIACGVEDIHITTNYLADQMDVHMSQHAYSDRICCVREDQFLGTVGAVKLVQKHMNNDDVLIMNSDLFTDVDFEEFYCHFKQHDADLSVVGIPYSYSIPYGIFELDGRNIQTIMEKPTFNYYANAGIYLLKKEVLEEIPDGVYFDATDLIQTLVEKGKQVIRYPHAGYWIDIGSHQEYQRAQDLVKHI